MPIKIKPIECVTREALDNRLAQHLRGSVSFVNFKDGLPERTLDLGCGVSPELGRSTK
jgi:hypothetical protein